MNPTFNGNQYSKLIDDISSKISQSNEINLKDVPKCILYLILHNENFQIESMDSLFDLINEIFSREKDENKDEEYDIIKFYELIDIKKLSKKNYKAFLSKLDFKELTFNLWSKLYEILFKYKEEKNQENKSKNKELEIEFDGQPNHLFNGIIHHLQESEKTSFFDQEIINVSSSSYRSNHLPKNAIDFDNNNYFLANNGNAWLKYDFKEKKIRPTRYSIRVNNSDLFNPMNWFIEVSNTNKDDDWRIIDSRIGITSISKANQSNTFDVSTHLSDHDYYRYIRFRCNGKTSGNCLCLAISSLEYFGNLI